MNLKAHIEETTEEHLGKTWSELMKAKEELDEVKEIGKGHVEEMQGRVEQLLSEKKAMETSLKIISLEVSVLKLSEKKLEVENLSLRTKLFAEMKEDVASENRSLKEFVQTMKTRLNAIEKKDEGKAVKVTLDFLKFVCLLNHTRVVP